MHMYIAVIIITSLPMVPMLWLQCQLFYNYISSIYRSATQTIDETLKYLTSITGSRRMLYLYKWEGESFRTTHCAPNVHSVVVLDSAMLPPFYTFLA